MKRLICAAILCFGVIVLLAGCGRRMETDGVSGALPPSQVEHEQDSHEFQVIRPEQFPMTTVREHIAAPKLTVTGGVSLNVSRTVPTISLASGCLVEIKSRMGDTVQREKLLLRVRSGMEEVNGIHPDQQVCTNALDH